MTLKNLQNESYKIRMTPEEKAAMRANLFGLPAQAGTPTPVATSITSPYFFFDFQFMSRAIAALLVVILVGGTGVAYAAEGSLPGDALYAVKVNVTEPIKTALATNPAARAAVHVELAQRRVEEAEALAAKGTLDSTTTAELEESLESHAQSADDLATEVGATDPSAAVEIKAELASSLGVHGALLAAIGDESASTTAKDNSERFAARVIARADAAVGAPASVTGAKVLAVAQAQPKARSMAKVQTHASSAVSTATVTAEATATPTAAVAPAATNTGSGDGEDHGGGQTDKLKSRAQSALDKAKATYADAKASLDSEAINSLDGQFTEAQVDIDAGNYGQALRLALKLQVVIEAQTKYRTNIITPLLKVQLTTSENSRGQDVSGDSGDNH